jgi:hypothetical protein
MVGVCLIQQIPPSHQTLLPEEFPHVGFSLHVSKEGRRLTEKLLTAKGSSGCHSIRRPEGKFPERDL